MILVTKLARGLRRGYSGRHMHLRNVRKILHQTATIVSFAVLITFSSGLGAMRVLADTCPKGMDKFTCEAVYGPWEKYDPFESNDACASVAVGSLTGKDAQEQGWNYFKSKGLSDITTAAIWGNLMHESSFNPQIMEIGGTSKNPRDADPKGYGIAQWTPGSKIITNAATNNITGPIYELLTQLNLVWAQLNGVAPTGRQDVLSGLKEQKTLADAVSYFQVRFESGANYDPRYKQAQYAMTTYAGVTAGGDTTTTTSSCGSGGATNCDTAVGNAKILCQAKVYDPISYVWGGGHQGAADWHEKCPTIGPNCGADCSGLINIVIYDLTGKELNGVVSTFYNDKSNWKQVPVTEAQPGDLLIPTLEHVEIVDHVVGSSIYSFGAHTSKWPQTEQVGLGKYPYKTSEIFAILRWVGQPLN